MKKAIILIFALFVYLNTVSGQDDITLSENINGKYTIQAKNSITLKSGFEVKKGNFFKASIGSNTNNNVTIDQQNTSTKFLPVEGTTGKNFIKTLTFVKPCYSLESSEGKFNETISYYDDLGRPEQTIIVNAYNGKDMVSFKDYDEYGRERKKYLPFLLKEENNNGNYVNNIVDQQLDFYESQYRCKDKKPYSCDDLDLSPISYRKSTIGVGEMWHKNNKRTTHNLQYSSGDFFNEEDGKYQYGNIRIIEEIDENGNITKQYYDSWGNLIRNENIIGDQTYRTLYIYSDFTGKLIKVIPPKASSSNDKNLCYFYSYNREGLMISKTIPGGGKTEYIYDNCKQLVMIQNEKQREESKYSFIKYDKYGRIILKGTLSSTLEANKIRSLFNDQEIVSEEFDINQAKFYGYTCKSYPSKIKIKNEDIEEVNWYDTYEYLKLIKEEKGKLSYKTISSYSSIKLYQADKYFIIGLKTGGVKKNIGDIALNNNFDYFSLYYDSERRLIAQGATNIMGGLNLEFNQYETITNNLLKNQRITINKNDVILNQIHTYTYDHYQRLINLKIKINDFSEITLESISYDEMGKKKRKALYSLDGQSYKIKQDFDYNIRGWLTSINKNIDESGLFSINLEYNKGKRPQWNGNISATTYKTKLPLESTELYNYEYNYDPVNRLTNAFFSIGDSQNQSIGAYDTHYTYDKNGNIKTLLRKEEQIVIDNLEYNYKKSSNQLETIVDKSDSERKEKGYVVRALGEKYTYDSNGNLTFDISKNVLISYNKLNLPSTVSFLSKGKIDYVYDSNGTKKLRKVSGLEQGSEGTTYYIDNQVYKDGELDYILFKGGRIIITEKDNKKNIVYEYHLKDHLGNVCVASQIDQKGGINIVQKSNYYPFGLKLNTSYNASTSTPNMYGYNGKEEQNVGFDGVKLGWLDYGWRMYDPLISRWHVIDPLSRRYTSFSPYSYTLNNPIKYTDPDGCKVTLNKDGNYDVTGDDIVAALDMLKNSNENFLDAVKFAANNGGRFRNLLGGVTVKSDGNNYINGYDNGSSNSTRLVLDTSTPKERFMRTFNKKRFANSMGTIKLMAIITSVPLALEGGVLASGLNTGRGIAMAGARSFSNVLAQMASGNKSIDYADVAMAGLLSPSLGLVGSSYIDYTSTGGFRYLGGDGKYAISSDEALLNIAIGKTGDIAFSPTRFINYNGLPEAEIFFEGYVFPVINGGFQGSLK